MDLPTSLGWYVVWRRGPSGAFRRALYFCVETTPNGKVSCMSARPADDEEPTPVTHECFAGALWHGPFKTRGDASAMLR